MAPIDARVKLEQKRRNKRQQQQQKGGKPGGGSKTSTGNVKDLRQIIAKKSKRKNDRSPDKTVHGRIAKSRPNSMAPTRDLRDTNRKLASRRNISQTRDKSQSGRRMETRSNKTSTVAVATRQVSNPRTVRMGSRMVPEQQYYTPPHLQRNQPTYIVSAPPATAARKSNVSLDAGHNDHHGAGGASILISNLSPEATQSDIIEIFGNVGVMTAVNIINQTTALVTYQNSSDAVRAVKFYNNRLLDGKPMLVNMMPNNM